jgi:hypothetical protein
MPEKEPVRRARTDAREDNVAAVGVGAEGGSDERSCRSFGVSPQGGAHSGEKAITLIIEDPGGHLPSPPVL